jgi:hypothetical protein
MRKTFLGIVLPSLQSFGFLGARASWKYLSELSLQIFGRVIHPNVLQNHVRKLLGMGFPCECLAERSSQGFFNSLIRRKLCGMLMFSYTHG